MRASDDHELMLAVRDGRINHLAELFKRHHVAVYNFFRKLGHARSDSEDLVQETFLRMLRYASGYAKDGHFGAWMYRIARNVAADAWSRAPQGSEDISELELPAAPHQEPDALHAQAELEALLQQALAMLPRDKRELVLLSRQSLLDTAQLAELYGCSTGALKVRLHRSLELLREHFDALRRPSHEAHR